MNEGVRTGLFSAETPNMLPDSSKGPMHSAGKRPDEFAEEDAKAKTDKKEEELKSLEEFLGLDAEASIGSRKVTEGTVGAHKRTSTKMDLLTPPTQNPTTQSLDRNAFKTMVSGAMANMNTARPSALTLTGPRSLVPSSTPNTPTYKGSPKGRSASLLHFNFASSNPPGSPIKNAPSTVSTVTSTSSSAATSHTSSTSATTSSASPPTASTSSMASAAPSKTVTVTKGEPEDKALSLWERTKRFFDTLSAKKHDAINHALYKKNIHANPDPKQGNMLDAFIYFLRKTSISKHDMKKIISAHALWKKGVSHAFTKMCFQITYVCNVLATMDAWQNSRLKKPQSASDFMSDFNHKVVSSIHSNFLQQFLASGLLGDASHSEKEWKQIEELKPFFDKDSGINTEAIPIDIAIERIEEALNHRDEIHLHAIKEMMRKAFEDVLEQQQNNVLYAFEAPLGAILREFLLELSTPVKPEEPQKPAPTI